LDQHLYAGPGKQLAKLVIRYFCLVDFLWDEQKLPEEQLLYAKQLLYKTLRSSPGAEENEKGKEEREIKHHVQPWYKGQGVSFIDKIIHNQFENVYYYPRMIESEVAKNYIYVVNSKTVHFNYLMWKESLEEKLTCFELLYPGKSFVYCRGIGIFSNNFPSSILEIQTSNDENKEQEIREPFCDKVALFQLNQPSSISECFSVFNDDGHEFYESIKRKLLTK
jgi:hypothetical protein